MTTPSPAPANLPVNFIRHIVEADLANGRTKHLVTRFPPEPNGYLHFGHAKSICLNFGLARDYEGRCHLRLDDTNPAKEEQEFADAIEAAVRWLGFDWAKHLYFASDYFEQLYDFAQALIESGDAYVDSQSADEMRSNRGTLTSPGQDSVYRKRSIAENLQLFRDMRAGKYPDGAHVLRAKIDMRSPNMNLRDPVLYRIRHAEHHRTGNAWCIYPLYDYAHPLSDAIEGITHSICTLEFEDHRPLYDWFLDQLPLPHGRPRQREFARLELTHTVTSKRRLATLVADGVVDGWDDPRLPTLRGLRRRGYPPAAIREFCDFIGVARTNSRHEIELLESFVRRELNATAQRRMVVLRPLLLTITNWPVDDEGSPLVVDVEVPNNPEDPGDGTRSVPCSGRLWIEAEDFMAEPPPRYHRLTPGREVRLRGAFYVTCTGFREEAGRVVEVECTYDPATRGGSAPDGRKVKSTIHWVSVEHAVPVQVALYERLFSAEVPGEATGDPLDDLNPDSRELLGPCRAEPEVAATDPGQVLQFERLGYFAHDPRIPGLFHRTVGLRDEWANIQKRRG